MIDTFNTQIQIMITQSIILITTLYNFMKEVAFEL